MGNMVMVFSGQLVPLEIPAPYAYKLRPEEADRWLFNGIVTSMSPNRLEFAIEYTITVSEWREDLVEVRGYFNSISGCENYFKVAFDVPEHAGEGDTFTLSHDWSASFTGELVHFVAHIHDGAKKLSITNTRTGDVLFSREPEKDGDHHDTIHSSPISIKMLEPHRTTVVYDSSEARYAAMAIFWGFARVEEAHKKEDLPDHRHSESLRFFLP